MAAEAARNRLRELRDRIRDENEQMGTELEGVTQAYDELEAMLQQHRERALEYLAEKLQHGTDYEAIIPEVDNLIGQNDDNNDNNDVQLLTQTLERLTLEHDSKEATRLSFQRITEHTVPRMRDDVEQNLECHTSELLNFDREERPGFFRCNENGCILCREELTDNEEAYTLAENAQTFTSTQTQHEHTVGGRYSCLTPSIVYLLTCAKEDCGAQYVGHTEDNLRKAVKDILAPSARRTKVQRHFKEDGCGRRNLRCLVIAMEQDREYRKERKGFWIGTLQTKGRTPLQLNERS